MSILKKITIPLLLALMMSACSVQYSNVTMTPQGRPYINNIKPKMQRDIQELTGALMSLGPNIDPREASEIAYDAYVYPLHLANEWGLTWPPLLHNTLRNANLRPKGLCTDWASAMIDHMRRKNLRSFDIYWAVAFRGNPWREHSTLLVTAKGYPFDTGIILDPWRDSGKLYWLRHVEDPAYQWAYHAGPFGPLPRQGRPVRRIIR